MPLIGKASRLKICKCQSFDYDKINYFSTFIVNLLFQHTHAHKSLKVVALFSNFSKMSLYYFIKKIFL